MGSNVEPELQLLDEQQNVDATRPELAEHCLILGEEGCYKSWFFG